MAESCDAASALMSGDKWTNYLVLTNTSQSLLIAFICPTGCVKLRPIDLPRISERAGRVTPEWNTYIEHAVIINEV